MINLVLKTGCKTIIVQGDYTNAFWLPLICVFLSCLDQDAGGMMTLTDVYCRFNRARGMEVS